MAGGSRELAGCPSGCLFNNDSKGHLVGLFGQDYFSYNQNDLILSHMFDMGS